MKTKPENCVCYHCPYLGSTDCPCNDTEYYEKRCNKCKWNGKCEVSLHPELYPKEK